MTTPHQPAPDGAYVVGGNNALGEGFNFGQDMTETIAKSLYMPVVSFIDQLGALAANLLKMPLDVLKQFMPAIPGATAAMFKDVPTAVQTIINWFTGLGKLLLVGDFLGFLRQVTGGVSDDFGELVQEFINMLNPLNSIPYILSVLNQILDIISGAFTAPINGALAMLQDWFNALTGKTQALTVDGELDGGNIVGTIASSVVEGLDDLGDTVVGIGNDLVATGQAIVNGWFGGSSATGTPAEVQTTIETIKQAVINGYTVDTITSSQSYAKPSTTISELVVIGIGAGDNGAGGSSGTTTTGGNGGAGGVNGGYLALKLDPDSITWPVDVTIGTNAQPTLFGSYLTTTRGAGGIQGDFGYQQTSSTPGSGGDGGKGGFKAGTSASYGTYGATGSSSAAAMGGVGGSPSALPAGTGTAGGAVSAGAEIKCGGGGAGGGGGGNPTGTLAQAVGGNGANGGYPGGGGGGGGGGAGFSTGSHGGGGWGGNGATGVLWVFWKA